MILGFCLGLLSALFAPRGWKFPVVSFWAAALVATSATQAFAW